VWVDHQEARVFHVDLDGFDEHKLRAPQHLVHRHPKGPSEPHGHPDDLNRFFEEIAKALASADQILVVGPSTAKAQLVKYFADHSRALAARVIEVEAVDHPTDAQLVALVRRHFHVSEPRVR